VALKFSMLAHGDRLTVPAVGDRGDWLVKFPDYRFADVPRNEYVTMSLAGAVGIEVPEILLVHRDELDGLPARMWPNDEQWAYAVKRFDRSEGDRKTSVHIEDFAQVRDFYPHQKYSGSFDTVAAVAYRGRDLAALREFGRRLAFSALVGNGDAHLKNWSLIYPDGRVPTLSPAYDLVSTFLYREEGEGPENLGLTLGSSKRFEEVGPESFTRLERHLDRRFGHTGAGLAEIAAETAERVVARWPAHREELRAGRMRTEALDEWIRTRADALLRRG
jgi:serine/threonine-protein kinase HipA